MQYQIQQIAAITNGVFLQKNQTDSVIENISLDTRQITFPGSSLFIALKGRHFDAHDFLKSAYENGIRNFLISKKTAVAKYPDANFIQVEK